MSTEHSILKISALGLLAQSVTLLSFRTDFKIHEIVISIVHYPSVPRLETFSSFGIGRSYLCCRLCLMCSPLRRGSNVRYINPLCEVFAGAKSNAGNPVPALTLLSGSSPPEEKPFEPLRRRESNVCEYLMTHPYG